METINNNNEFKRLKEAIMDSYGLDESFYYFDIIPYHHHIQSNIDNSNNCNDCNNSNSGKIRNKKFKCKSILVYFIQDDNQHDQCSINNQISNDIKFATGIGNIYLNVMMFVLLVHQLMGIILYIMYHKTKQRKTTTNNQANQQQPQQHHQQQLQTQQPNYRRVIVYLKAHSQFKYVESMLPQYGKCHIKKNKCKGLITVDFSRKESAIEPLALNNSIVNGYPLKVKLSTYLKNRENHIDDQDDNKDYDNEGFDEDKYVGQDEYQYGYTDQYDDPIDDIGV